MGACHKRMHLAVQEPSEFVVLHRRKKECATRWARIKVASLGGVRHRANMFLSLISCFKTGTDCTLTAIQTCCTKMVSQAWALNLCVGRDEHLPFLQQRGQQNNDQWAPPKGWKFSTLAATLKPKRRPRLVATSNLGVFDAQDVATPT